MSTNSTIRNISTEKIARISWLDDVDDNEEIYFFLKNNYYAICKNDFLNQNKKKTDSGENGEKKSE